jgi:hypothetical protein
MFAEPTINDFLDNIRWHLTKAATNAGRAVGSVQSELAARGALQSGRAVLMIFDAVRKEYDGGIETALGELKRTIARTRLDRRDLRQATVQCLENFTLEMKALTKADQYRALVGKMIDEKLGEFDDHLRFTIRQFDTGFFDPHEPERPHVNNSINVGTMTGSAIQQSSPGAKQNVEFKLNIDEAKAALSTFQASIEASQLPRQHLDEISADLRTIASQLSKTSPSLQILQEAGRSVRSIVEGVAASLLTPGVIAAAPALWSALGLG